MCFAGGLRGRERNTTEGSQQGDESTSKKKKIGAPSFPIFNSTLTDLPPLLPAASPFAAREPQPTMLRARPSSSGGVRALARPSGPSQRGLSPPRNRPQMAPLTPVLPSVPSAAPSSASSHSRAVLAVAAAAHAPSSPDATLSVHPDAVRRRQR